MEEVLTPHEIKNRNEVKKRLYSMFHQVEKEVIDMVLSSCDYNENEAYEHIIVMAGDNLDDNSTKRPELHNERCLDNVNVTEQIRSPTNLFEQLSSSPNVNNGSPPFLNAVILPDQTRNTEYLFPVSTFSSLDSTFSLNDYSVLQRDYLYTDFSTPPSKLKGSTDLIGAYPEKDIISDLKEITENRFKTDSLKSRLNSIHRLNLVIIRGLPGSGKSSLAKSLCGLKGKIFSSDDFFMINGFYRFDKTRLSEAHEWNQRRASKAFQHRCSPIFIDNTNTQVWEMKPYVSMGLKHNYEMMILEPETDWAWKPKILALKNSHGVPQHAIVKMLERYETNITIEYMINLIRPNYILMPSSPKTQHRKQAFSRLEDTQINHKHVDYNNGFIIPTAHDKNGEKLVDSTVPNLNNRLDNFHQQKTLLTTYNEKEPDLKTKNYLASSELFSHSTEFNTSFNPLSTANSTVFPADPVMITSSLDMLNVPELPTIPTSLSAGFTDEPIFTEPPRVIRVVDLENEPSFSNYTGSGSSKHEDPKSLSTSRIGDIVKNYKSWSDDNLDKDSNISQQLSQKSPSIIDLTNVDGSDIEDLATKSGNMNLNSFGVAEEQFKFSLEFLYECFPDFSKPYCKKWLKKYNGDIVKTCDYLSRLSQVDDGDDIQNDNLADGSLHDSLSDEFPSELPKDSHAEKQLDIALFNVVEPRKPDGELFYVEEHGDQCMNIAMNRKFGKELLRRYGKDGDIDESKLSFEDYIFDIDENVGEKLYSCWLTSVRAKKRKLESILHDDEQYVLQLQEEENKSLTDSPDGITNRTKRRKMKPLSISTELTKNSTAQLKGGLFSPSSPWKTTQDTQEVGTEIKDATGNVLTSKQLNIRAELHQQFPGVEEDDLNQVLTATSYNLQAAVALVRDSCNLTNNKVRNVHADGTDWIFVESPSRNKNQKETSLSPSRNKKRVDASSSKQLAASPGSSNYQAVTEEEQGYVDFRTEAHLHANLRAECFQKAAKAFQEKNWQVAQYYADQAHQHTLKMKESHQRAAELTIWRRNKVFMKDQRVIDLHGLHADEAVRALKNFLKNAANVGHRQVEIITGRGLHSKNGYSTVKHAVQSVLAQRRYKFNWANHGGSVIVNL